MTAKRFDLLVIGELNVDLILTGPDLKPHFGQVEQLVEDALLALGSSSAILACGAARLGLHVAFAGMVGADEFGNFVRRELEGHGVDLVGVRTDTAHKTGVTVHLSQPHDRSMLTFPGTMMHFSKAEIDPRLLQEARHVHLSSYFLQPGLQPSIPELFALAHQSGASTSLDPGWDASQAWDSGLPEALRQVDIFLPNAAEAMAISQTAGIQEALHQLAHSIPSVVIKLGSQGVAARHQGQEYSCPVFPVTPVETTGAGDNFNAGFLYAYLQGFDLPECLRWGSACGALATLQAGGLDGQHNAEGVRQWMSRAIAT